MPYLYIENYEIGLDSRKTPFTAPAGSLRTLTNAHINRGKEIEKRKAFAEFATLPAGTYGLHEVGNQLFVFGSAASPSMPPTMEYQQLTSATAGNMTRIWDTESFGGAIYAIAEFDTGEVHHFYDGTRVADWDAIAAASASAESVAAALSRRLESDNIVVSEARGNIVQVTADPGVAFSVSGVVSGGTGTISTTSIQLSSPAVPEVLATCSFTVTGGTPGPTFNTISSVTVDGVDLIGGPLDFDTDVNTTAAAVASRITSYSGTNHTAAAVGAVVTITAPVGTGASPNGDVLAVGVTGTVTVGSITNMASGADPVAAVAQISEVTITAFDIATLYTIDIDGIDYEILGQYSYIPLFCRTHKDKIYAGVLSLLYFSGFNSGVANPAQWNGSGTAPTGEGFINLANQARGAEEVVAVGVYQDRIAAYSRQSTQIWTVDPDPALNSLYQVLYNVGAEAPASVVEYGDIDVFHLDRSGVRSLRARDSSNLVSASDVGAAVDTELVAFKDSLSPDLVRSARGVLEPVDGRYLLALGSLIYVFSSFPGSRVSAWSTYDLGPGQGVEWWAATSNRLYARTGDTVKLYGGATGTEYDDEQVVIITPHLDASDPGMAKLFHRLDVGLTGTWSVSVNTEPNDPNVWEDVGTFNASTYGSVQAAALQGRGTHIALRFINEDTSAAVLGNTLIHFDEAERW